MILITSPISYGLIALAGIISFIHLRGKKEDPITAYFNKLFIWSSLYGLHWAIVSIIVLIKKEYVPFVSFTYPLGHFFAFVALAYGIRIGLCFLNVSLKKVLVIIILYSIIAATGLILNIFYPSLLAVKDYGYVFINANKLIGILWFLPVMLAILFLAVIFWWQAIKKLTDSSARKKTISFAVVFSIIVLVVPIRNIFEGFYPAIISEISLMAGMLIGVIAFFVLKENETTDKLSREGL